MARVRQKHAESPYVSESHFPTADLQDVSPSTILPRTLVSTERMDMQCQNTAETTSRTPMDPDLRAAGDAIDWTAALPEVDISSPDPGLRSRFHE